ncbi:PAS domain-containing protein [bacterium]|nr:PAS domain-containing protein [bacterium]
MFTDPAALRTLDALPHFAWVADPDGALLYINRRCAEYTGLAIDDMLGWDWSWVIHPDDLATTVARWAESVKNGTPHRDEFRLRRDDGQYRWFLGRADPVRDDDGQVVRWIGTCVDVDDIHRTGADTRTARQLVRAFVERNPDGLALVGADRIIRYASPGLVALLGRPAGVYVGTDALDWVHRDARPRLAQLMEELLARSGGVVSAGFRMSHADGSYRRVRGEAINLIPDPDVRAVAVTLRADLPEAAAPEAGSLP